MSMRRVLFLFEPVNRFIGVQVVIREVPKVPGTVIILMRIVVLPHASVDIAGHVGVCHARLKQPVTVSYRPIHTTKDFDASLSTHAWWMEV